MIKTFVGPMFSDKSASLIDIYKKMYHKELICAFKPYCDTRDGEFIKSRSREESIPAICINDLSEIKKYVIDKNIHTVFIDEIQMMSGDARELLDLTVLYEIDFYIAGLNMTGEQKPFGIIGDVLAVSDQIVNLTGFCEDCNKESVYSLFLGEEQKSEILPGDKYYAGLCPKCLRKRMQNRNNVSLIRGRK